MAERKDCVPALSLYHGSEVRHVKGIGVAMSLEPEGSPLPRKGQAAGPIRSIPEWGGFVLGLAWRARRGVLVIPL